MNLDARDDTDAGYCLERPACNARKRPALFAATEIDKNYASMHLAAVYCFPERPKAISPELKKHQQGKACFQFTAPDARLFRELAEPASAGG